MTDIRLSPSGPKIQNDNGGPLTPGPGMQLRLNEAATIIGTHSAITTETDVAASPTNPPPLTAELANPNAAYNYRAEIHVDCEPNGSKTEAQFKIYASYDDPPSTWTPIGETWNEVAAAASPGARPCKGLALMQQLAVPDGAPKITVKASVTATGSGLFLSSIGTPPGAAHIQLWELF